MVINKDYLCYDVFIVEQDYLINFENNEYLCGDLQIEGSENVMLLLFLIKTNR